MSMSQDTARGWVKFWYELRHTGGYGHTASQARGHVRYFLPYARKEVTTV